MQNRSYNTKALVEAGLITAIIVVIMLINVYIPIFSLLLNFILPIPVTVLYIRHNFNTALGSVIASGILISLLYNPLSGLTTTIIFGLTGLTFGYCIKNKVKFSNTIIFLAMASVLGVIIDTTVYANLITKVGIIGVIDENIKVFKESLNSVTTIYSSMGVSKDQIDSIIKPMQLLLNRDTLMKLIPSMLVIMGFISAYLSYIISKKILSKLKYKIEEEIRFSEIYINNRIVLMIAVLYIIGAIMSSQKVSASEYILVSSMILLQFVITVDGLSVADYYLRNKFNIPKALTIIILVFTAFTPLAMGYFLIGLVDTIMDFRKLDPYRKIRKM